MTKTSQLPPDAGALAALLLFFSEEIKTQAENIHIKKIPGEEQIREIRSNENKKPLFSSPESSAVKHIVLFTKMTRKQDGFRSTETVIRAVLETFPKPEQQVSMLKKITPIVEKLFPRPWNLGADYHCLIDAKGKNFFTLPAGPEAGLQYHHLEHLIAFGQGVAVSDSCEKSEILF